MINRFLLFLFSFIVVSGLLCFSIFIFEVKLSGLEKKTTVEKTAYFDIEMFLSGQALAQEVTGYKPALSKQPFRRTDSTQKRIFRYPVNVEQLMARNAVDERIRKNSRRRMQRFADRLPQVIDNYGAKTFFKEKKKSQVQKDIEKMLKYAKKHKGIPYVWGGTTVKGFDCSGFTRHTYRHLGVKLPRNSHHQSKLGKVVPLAQAQPGDMVFFGKKIGDTYKTNHTGIVVENNNGSIRMIHSTYRGVVVDEVMKINSYARRFLFVKRMF